MSVSSFDAESRKKSGFKNGVLGGGGFRCWTLTYMANYVQKNWMDVVQS